MKFFIAKNLTQQAVKLGTPWSYKMPAVSETVRKVKSARQAWYRNPETKHSFYTTFEGVNSQVRVGNENPAWICHGLVADIDHPYIRAELDELIVGLPFSPGWLEKSLGKGWRLVWEFEQPLRWPNCPRLSDALLESFAQLLGVSDIVGMDKSSWARTTQLYANGGEWNSLPGQSIDLPFLESTVFNTAVAVAKRTRNAEVVLPRIEGLIKKKWPGWEWPVDFVEGSQGPSWWVEGSTSPKSAIVHEFGMFTFADHADGKTLWTWEDLLGAGAVERNKQELIAAAVADYYTDNRQFMRPREDGGFEELNPQAMRRALAVVHGLSAKVPKKSSVSEVDKAIAQIEKLHRVDLVAPFVFRKPGIISRNGYRYLNTLDLFPLEPAPEGSAWGPEGNFPFLSNWLGRIFVHSDQLEHFLLWWHWAYKNAVDRTPEQGQGFIMQGGPGIGKTLLNSKLIAPSFGGGENAVRYLMREDSFGGHLFRRGYWMVDDQTMTASVDKLRKFAGAFKRVIANCEHEYHIKFGTPCQLPWMGRVGVTCNPDMFSKLIIISLEESVRDKVNFYRCINNLEDGPNHDRLPDGFFPRRIELERTISQELPHLLKHVYDLEIPERWAGDSRYGIKSFHDDEMKAASFLNSGGAAAYELLEAFMEYYISFSEKIGAEAQIFEGTTTKLLTSIHEIPALVPVARGMTIDGLTRRLGQMSDVNKELISSYTNEFNSRIWIINWNNRKKKKTST